MTWPCASGRRIPLAPAGGAACYGRSWAAERPPQKPPKGEPAFSRQRYPRLLSPLRAVIAHVRRGIKRVRMVRDQSRVRGDWFRDTVVGVACGLPNLHVRSPHRA